MLRVPEAIVPSSSFMLPPNLTTRGTDELVVAPLMTGVLSTGPCAFSERVPAMRNISTNIGRCIVTAPKLGPSSSLRALQSGCQWKDLAQRMFLAYVVVCKDAAYNVFRTAHVSASIQSSAR